MERTWLDDEKRRLSSQLRVKRRCVKLSTSRFLSSSPVSSWMSVEDRVVFNQGIGTAIPSAEHWV